MGWSGAKFGTRRAVAFAGMVLAWWLALAMPAAGQTLSGSQEASGGAVPRAGDADVDRSAGPEDFTVAAQTAAGVDLGSPRATMFSFLAAMNRVHDGYDDGWSAAAACLEKPAEGDWPPSRLREAAAALMAVLDRLGEVKPGQLPDASVLEQAAGEGHEAIRRFVFFPRPAHDWVWAELQKNTGGQVTAPAGRIVLARDDGGRWRFSAQTVDGAAGLEASTRALPPRYAPPSGDAPHDSHVMALLGPTFERTPLWGWGALLGAIFAGLVAGKLLQMLLLKVGDRAERRGWGVRGTMLRGMASPASLACVSAGVMVGLWFVRKTEALDAFVDKVIAFLFILAVGWLFYNLVEVIEVALRRVTQKTDNRIDDMIVPMIRKTLRIFLVIVFTLAVAQNIFGLNITGWLAGLGIAGLAVSLAAQDSVKNLFGSLTIFFDRPFLAGDFIKFDGETGKVEEIGFRSTRMRLLSGHLVTVPNMKFIDGKVENISARPYIRREMNITITYDTRPQMIEQAVAIVRDILHSQEVVGEGRFDMDKFPPRIAFNELNADSLNIKAFYWYQLDRDPDRGFFTFMDHSQMVNLKLFKAFGETGIDFAFPTQTLYLAGDPGRELAVKVVGE